ncbi:MAG: hypothetical protein Q7R95_03640 [bacterium]|nr:hypothetical protein [bacterium]
MNNVCSVCHIPLLEGWFFCPNCGKAIKEAPISISIAKQIMIYAVSFFLAPLGLGWGLKYIKSKDQKIRLVGIISIALTIIAILMLVFAFKGVADQYSKMLNNINTFPNL